MAVNAPIQGTSADIIKLAMIAIDAWAKKEKADDLKLVLQVHDELVYECDTKNAERYAAEIKKRMETVVPKEKSKGVPLVAEYEIGDNWGVI
jgi:DNA polymerase-1